MDCDTKVKTETGSPSSCLSCSHFLSEGERGFCDLCEPSSTFETLSPPIIETVWKQAMCKCMGVFSSKEEKKNNEMCRFCTIHKGATKETELSFVYFVGNASSRREFILKNKHFADYCQPRKAQLFTSDQTLAQSLIETKSNFNVSHSEHIPEDWSERWTQEHYYYHQSMLVFNGCTERVMEKLKEQVASIKQHRSGTFKADVHYDEYRIWILEDAKDEQLSFLEPLFQVIQIENPSGEIQLDSVSEDSSEDVSKDSFPWSAPLYPNISLINQLLSKTILLFEGDEVARTQFVVNHVELFGNTYSYGRQVFSSNETLASYFGNRKSPFLGHYSTNVVKDYDAKSSLSGVQLSLDISGANMVVFDNQWSKEDFTTGSGNWKEWLELAQEQDPGYLALWLLVEPGSVPTSFLEGTAVRVNMLKQTAEWNYYICNGHKYRQVRYLFSASVPQFAKPKYAYVLKDRH